MLIYDQKGNNIDVYTMNPKVEELKKYRRNVMRRQKIEDMFYSLKTNCKETIESISRGSEVDIKIKIKMNKNFNILRPIKFYIINKHSIPPYIVC